MSKSIVLLLVLSSSLAFADKHFNSGHGTSWSCAKDPVVHINTSTGNYALTGACKEVHLNGAANKVTIESVAELHVNGARNTVAVDKASNIHINGAHNTVTYRKGLVTAAPRVHDNGVGNTITRAK